MSFMQVRKPQIKNNVVTIQNEKVFFFMCGSVFQSVILLSFGLNQKKLTKKNSRLRGFPAENYCESLNSANLHQRNYIHAGASNSAEFLTAFSIILSTTLIDF